MWKFQRLNNHFSFQKAQHLELQLMSTGQDNVFFFFLQEPNWLAHQQVFWNIGHANNITSLDPQLHTQPTCEETSLAFSSGPLKLVRSWTSLGIKDIKENTTQIFINSPQQLPHLVPRPWSLIKVPSMDVKHKGWCRMPWACPWTGPKFNSHVYKLKRSNWEENIYCSCCTARCAEKLFFLNLRPNFFSGSNSFCK